MMNYFHRFALKSQRLRDLGRPAWSSSSFAQSGQAMVEYILMLVIVVMIILGMVMAFFNPMQKFIAQLNSTYIKCLLETGELPTMKSETPAQCAAEMPKFEVGADLNGGDGKGGPGSSGGSADAENRRGESSSESSGSADADAGSSVGGGRPPNRTSSLIRGGMRSSGSARGELADGKVTNVPVDQFEAGQGFMSLQSSAARSATRKKTQKVGIDGLMEYDRKKAQREEEKVRSIAMESESFTNKKNKKIIVKPPEEKKSDEDLKVKADFGFYFKIAFMIIIFLFIIILAVSQGMQMNNGSGD